MAHETESGFDPYRKWLGIPKDQRPPSHYQLLGLSPGEADAEVIEEAAIRQTTHVRAYQVGQHGEVCTRILNEIAVARQTLLNPGKKKVYDQSLSDKAPKSEGVAPRRIEAETPFGEFEAVTTATPRGELAKVKRTPRKVSEPKSSPPWIIIAAAGGGTGLVGLIVLLVILLSGRGDAPTAKVGLPKVAIVDPLPKPVPDRTPKPNPEPAPNPPPQAAASAPPSKVIPPPPIPKFVIPEAPPMPIVKEAPPLAPPVVPPGGDDFVGDWHYTAPRAAYNLQQADLAIRLTNGVYTLRLQVFGSKNKDYGSTMGANIRREKGGLAFDLPTPIPRLPADSGLVEKSDGGLRITYQNSASKTKHVPMEFVRVGAPPARPAAVAGP